MTYFSALMISGNPVFPSSSLTGVSTRRIDASGAMVWLYSTSRVVSPAHPSWPGGTVPAGWMIVRDGGAGRPNVLSKTPRSCAMVGEPNASTMTMV